MVFLLTSKSALIPSIMQYKLALYGTRGPEFSYIYKQATGLDA